MDLQDRYNRKIVSDHLQLPTSITLMYLYDVAEVGAASPHLGIITGITIDLYTSSLCSYSRVLLLIFPSA